MNKINEFDIAICVFQKGISHIPSTYNHSKEYGFKVYDDGFDYKKGDYILVNTTYGWQVACLEKIIDINTDEAEKFISKYGIPKQQVICKIDCSKFDERLMQKNKMLNLKKEMDRIISEKSDEILYDIVANYDEHMKELLTEYRSLN